MKVRVEELMVGDRFRAYGALWTYLGRNARGEATARKHSQESIRGREAGYGYKMDTICCFSPREKVEFVPVGAGFIQNGP